MDINARNFPLGGCQTNKGLILKEKMNEKELTEEMQIP